MEIFWILLIIQAFVFGVFSSFIAKEKNRDQAGWFFSGFFFSFIALLALIAVPKLDKPLEPQRPVVQYVPTSPPILMKTKIIRLLLIFGSIIVFFVLAFLLKK